MSRATDLITKIEALINEYGITSVNSALEFTQKFDTNAKMVNIHGYKLTNDQYNKVREAGFNGGYYNTEGQYTYSKIQAIKMFREFVGCGLKEAKDAIESMTW